MADIVADTNVWYDLASKRLDPATLAGHRLLATPTSILELTTRVTEPEFQTRKAAADALKNRCAALLPDTETHLASIWGIPGKTSYAELFQKRLDAFCLLGTFADLQDAASVFAQTIDGPLDLSFNTPWRDAHYSDFASQSDDAIDFTLPNYLKRRAKGEMKLRNAEQREAHRKVIETRAFEEWTLAGTRLRVIVSLGHEPPPPTSAQVDSARANLQPYVRVWQQYVLSAGAVFAPEPNDFGDLEHFTYLQDGRRLLTRDQRFLTLAKEAYIEGSLFTP